MVGVISSRNHIKKKNIVRNIFLNLGISAAYSAKITNDLIKILILSLYHERKIKIKNFGTFSLQKKNKRIGINPISKKKHEIKARIVATFKAAKELNLSINKNVKK